MSRERERYDEIGKKIKRENRRRDAASVYDQQMGIIGSNVVMGSNLLNTIAPCAACKLLRRRCAEDCPFLPYFSPLEPHRFAAVHRVFGASNVCKMLMDVPESQRAAAANSLVCEANVRLRDPVHGCMGAISTLEKQVHLLQAELDTVRAEISRYRYREAANNNIVYNFGASTTHHAPSLISTEAAVSADMVLPMALASPPPLPPPPPPPSVKLSSSLYTSPASSEILYNPVPSNIIPYLD